MLRSLKGSLVHQRLALVHSSLWLQTVCSRIGPIIRHSRALRTDSRVIDVDPRYESQRTTAITSPIDNAVCTFFRAVPPSEVHCFDRSVVSVCPAAFMFQRRLQNDAETPFIALKQLQILLWSSLTVALVQSEQMQHHFVDSFLMTNISCNNSYLTQFQYSYCPPW